MTRLLLVDLDNLPFAGEGALWPRLTSQGDVAWTRSRQGQSPRSASFSAVLGQADIVVFAGNSRTHDKAKLRVDHLPPLAAAFADVVWPRRARDVGVECAICLTMPQTADAAVIRLLREAPEQGHVGPFDGVTLWSKDRGIRADVAAILGVAWGSARQTSEGVWRWTCPSPNFAWTRGWTAPVRAEQQIPLPKDWSARVSTGHHDAAVAALAGPFADLGKLSHAIERAPHLLSQVGITVESVRGVARLAGVVSGTAGTTVALCENDGAEVGIAAEPPRKSGASTVTASLLGNGAVRLLESGVTARSRLPWQLIAAQAPGVRRSRLRTSSDRAAFDDNGCLAATVGHFRGAPEVAVSLRRRALPSGELFLRGVVMTEDRLVGPRSWWALRYGNRLRAKSEFDVGLDNRWPCIHVHTDPCDAVAYVDGSDLVLAAKQTEVAAKAPRDHATTTRISVAKDPTTGIRSAVLHLQGMSRRYDRAVRIQSLDLPSDAPIWMDEQLWRDLQALPLLVRCQSSADAGVQPGTDVAEG